MSDLTPAGARHWLRQRLFRWLENRQSAACRVKLAHKFLLIFPTPFGFTYLGLVLLIYILGTNYQNNLVLLLSYLLLSVFLVTMVLCYQNLAGLELNAGSPSSTFTAQPLYLDLTLQHWQHRQSLHFQLGDWQCQQQQGILRLVTTPQQRGLHQLPRLKISSVHPFGLFRCWCYVAIAQQFWVYPTPWPQSVAVFDQADAGDQEWSHLSPYQAGDKLQRIDWKKLARQPTQWVVKVYQSQSPSVEVTRLVLPACTGAALERQLQLLTRQILDLSAAGLSYSLQLPQQTIAAASGPAHQQRCLQALTLC